MKLFRAEQMQKADSAAAEAGVDLHLLMESAGRAVADSALRKWPEARRFLVLCGKGNNGGDGYVAARHLHLAGKQVEVLEHARSQDGLGSKEAKVARAAWLAYDQATNALDTEMLQASLQTAEVVIDALFGSGLSRPLEGHFETIVGTVTTSGLPVLSVDVPSGISSDTAELVGPHVKATHTAQLAGPKVASVFPPAKDAFGTWEVADIGIPAAILAAQAETVLLNDSTVKPWLPTRNSDAHKYTVGTVLVVAGSSRYLGAAELAARAAYRAGAGLVTLAAEDRLPNSWPELIFERLEWANEPLATLAELDDKRAQARVIGPGLDERARPFLPELIAMSDAPTVVDAGALVADKDWQKAVKRHGRCVLTPHVGEASRLLGVESAEIQANPIEAAQRLATGYNAVAVLKGPATVIAGPEGSDAVSSRGHSGMATGGAGDVLSGLLGAWLANVEDARSLFERAAATVYLHGSAGEKAARRWGNGLVASDLIDAFPGSWLELA